MGRKKKDEALSLVDQLLANEKPVVKKRRGRPKGSKNKQKDNKARSTPEKKKNKKTEPLHQLQFVTQEQFEELGCPVVGYTTARSRQWKNKTHGYYEVQLEYIRAAIIWSKLAKTMDWYSNVDESHLSKCRREIKDFKVEHNLTHHDFFEVIAISHRHDHKRKKMLKSLRTMAKIVVENRRENEPDEKVNFREIARIPPNVRPILKHVKIKVPLIDLALADSPQATNEHACPEHLNYKGLRKPRNGCMTCRYFYNHNKKLGLKEIRNRN